jgi:hypothetical protein
VPLKLKVQVKGVRNMLRRSAQVRTSLSRRAGDAVEMEARAVMRTAKRVVPLDGGDLRDSGTVDPLQRKGTDFFVRLSFGDSGPSSSYALTLHEWPSPHDPPNWIGRQVSFSKPGTGPKYLETPLNAAMAGMDSRIAHRCRL